MRDHQDTIAAYAAQVIDQPDTLALIVVGSVARGTERATSDVDIYLVVTDEAFAAAQSARRVAYIDTCPIQCPDQRRGSLLLAAVASPAIALLSLEMFQTVIPLSSTCYFRTGHLSQEAEER